MSDKPNILIVKSDDMGQINLDRHGYRVTAARAPSIGLSAAERSRRPHLDSSLAVRARGPKGRATVITRSKSALFMVGVTAVSLINAPVADARPTCQSTDTMSICQTNGSVSIKARPGTVAPPGNMPHIPWFGVPGRRRR